MLNYTGCSKILEFLQSRNVLDYWYIAFNPLLCMFAHDKVYESDKDLWKSFSCILRKLET